MKVNFMNCIELNSGVKVSDVYDIDLEQTLDCGQSFRWIKKEDGSFDGVAFGKYVNIKLDKTDMYISNCTKSDFENIWYKYFDFELDYGKIRDEISKINPILCDAAKYAPGIRILRQEPYETLCTFIISQNNNIKRIKGIVERLCENFGEQIDEYHYAFPTAEKISRLNADDLAPLRAGFRNRYIIDAAQKVQSGQVNLDKCFTLSYEDAQKELMQITGVGKKVADCTLLFGMHRIEAFPIDVWMKKAMAVLFPKMTADDFGKYAGIAQQYIFHYSRMHPELFKNM